MPFLPSPRRVSLALMAVALIAAPAPPAARAGLIVSLSGDPTSGHPGDALLHYDTTGGAPTNQATFDAYLPAGTIHPFGLALAPDQHTLYVGTDDPSAWIVRYDLAAGAGSRQVFATTSPGAGSPRILGLTVAPTGAGQTLYAADFDDNQVLGFNTTTPGGPGTPFSPATGTFDRPDAVLATADGRYLFVASFGSGDDDGFVDRYDLLNGSARTRIVSGLTPESLALSPDETHLYVGMAAGPLHNNAGIRVYSLNGQGPNDVQVLGSALDPVTGIAFESPSVLWAVSSRNFNTIYHENIANYQVDSSAPTPIAGYEENINGVYGLTFETVGVPEPSAFGLSALVAAGLIAFRGRRGGRRHPASR